MRAQGKEVNRLGDNPWTPQKALRIFVVALTTLRDLPPLLHLPFRAMLHNVQHQQHPLPQDFGRGRKTRTSTTPGSTPGRYPNSRIPRKSLLRRLDLNPVVSSIAFDEDFGLNHRIGRRFVVSIRGSTVATVRVFTFRRRHQWLRPKCSGLRVPATTGTLDQVCLA